MIPVRNIIRKDFTKLSSSESIGAAANLMEKMDVDYLLIEEGEIWGIVTSRELVGYPLSRLLLDCAVKPVSTISEEALADEALRLLEGEKASFLVVLNAEGTPIGIANREIIIDSLFQELEKLNREKDNYITELKQAEEALETSKANFRNIVERSSDGIIVIDEGGIVRFVNPTAEAIFQHEADDLIGELFGFPVIEESVAELDIVRKGGEIGTGEIRAVETEWEGELAYLAMLRDITYRKQAEEDLREAKERAEASDRLKDIFLSTMSHEVRTPLNVILGYSDILASVLEKRLSEEEKEFLESIQESGERLRRLVDDILDVSQIEADRTMLNLKTYFADELIRKSVTNIIVLAQKKNLELLENYRAPNVRIKVDKVRLQQSLGNILDNAVKFTSRGFVAINTNANDGEFSVSVLDSGIGIREDFKPYLFSLFRQAEEGYSRSYEGAGLGLAICQRLVEAMGGRLEVVSKEGKGSTFTIFLPAEKGSEHKVRKRQKDKRIPLPVKATEKVVTESVKSELLEVNEESKNGKRTVLILEDNPANLNYMKFLVKKLGLDSICAETGEKALELLEDQAVACMLIDISLAEGMSGIEFLRRVRKKKKFKDVPKIAATAHAMKGQREKFLKEGFDDYLAKPFTLKDLKEVVNRNLSNQGNSRD